MFAAAVDARLGKWLADTCRFGLTEYRALLLLSGAPERELRIHDLAEQVGLNQSSVTRLLGRLEAKSLTYRDTCPDDGRGVFAVITEKGLDLVQELREPFEAKVVETLDDVAALGPALEPRQLSMAFAAIGAHLWA
ncbi:MarR family winged helix-turn-helix transcriptional regulator [Mycolicibacterium doricum]|nr:MarR family transcriptional regulator [Mycolicibacterium doricum]